MERTARFYLSPIAALVTLVIGVGFVRAAERVISLFEPAALVSREQPTEENIGVTSSENFKTFEPHDAATVTHGRVLSCYDPTILPIWQELKGDEVFKDTLSNSKGVMNCSDMIEIFRVDLNGDWKDEFLVRGMSPYLCSGTGNCGYWVFEEVHSRIRKLLASTDFVDIVGLEHPVQKSRTRGYSDLLLKSRISESETSYRSYVFDGRQYAKSRCVYERPKYRREGEGSWELVSCEKVERESDY